MRLADDPAVADFVTPVGEHVEFVLRRCCLFETTLHRQITESQTIDIHTEVVDGVHSLEPEPGDRVAPLHQQCRQVLRRPRFGKLSHRHKSGDILVAE